MSFQTPLRVLLVDDEPMALARLKRMLEGEHGATIVGECTSGDEAADALQTLRPDAVFLDVQMPGMDGFGALHRAAGAWQPKVVFVTAFSEHAVDAFEHGAVDYLLKPFSRERLRLALERLRGSNLPLSAPAEAALERIAVPAGRRLRMVPVMTIDCVVAQLNYVELHVGTERLVLRETMSAMESQLEPRHFVRVHRSRIVRIGAVTDVEIFDTGQYVLRLISGTKLTTGPAYRDRVRKAFRLS